jgi:hypothetical protein
MIVTVITTLVYFSPTVCAKCVAKCFRRRCAVCTEVSILLLQNNSTEKKDTQNNAIQRRFGCNNQRLYAKTSRKRDQNA